MDLKKIWSSDIFAYAIIITHLTHIFSPILSQDDTTFHVGDVQIVDQRRDEANNIAPTQLEQALRTGITVKVGSTEKKVISP